MNFQFSDSTSHLINLFGFFVCLFVLLKAGVGSVVCS